MHPWLSRAVGVLRTSSSALGCDRWIRQSGVRAANEIHPKGACHSASRSCGFSIVRASCHSRGLSVDTTGCQSNVMPTGSQIASASAKIRCRSDLLGRAGAVTATGIGLGGATAIAVAPQVTRVMRVANTVPQFPHTIFAGSLRSPRRRMPTVRAPSSDPET